MHLSKRPAFVPVLPSPHGPHHLTKRLLAGAAWGALLAIPVLVPLGVGLPATAQAQTVLPAATGEIVLANEGTGNPFVVNVGTSITNNTAIYNGKVIYGDNTQNWTITNAGTIFSSGNSGVVLTSASTITNLASGLIAATNGLAPSIASGTDSKVVNFGTIIGETGLGNGSEFVNSGRADTVEFFGFSNTQTADFINSGTLYGTSNFFLGGVEFDGLAGNVTNQGTAALIVGAKNGIAFIGETGTVTNEGTIIGLSGAGVYLHDGGNVTNQGSAALINGVRISGAAGTLTNSGQIIVATGNVIDGNAVSLITGTLVNQQSGLIRGAYSGVELFDGGLISNAGTISGVTGNGVSSLGLAGGVKGGVYNTAASATISGAINGVYFGRYDTVVNSGTISGATNAGVYQRTGGGNPAVGGVTNLGTAATIIGELNGVVLGNASASVVNAGTIEGTARDGVRGVLSQVTNQGTASLIEGGTDGVFIAYQTGVVLNNGTIAPFTASVSNQGTILGVSGHGLYLHGAGSVTNTGAGAVISGQVDGIRLDGGPMTVVNSGLIEGTGPAGIGLTFADPSSFYSKFNNTLINAGLIVGASGVAVRFGAGNDLLVLETGASFVGRVDGGSGSNTLELAAGVGSLSGLGTSFTNFGTVSVDAGGAWTLTGNNVASSTFTNAGSLTNLGTISGTVTLTGSGVLINNGVIIAQTEIGPGAVLSSGNALAAVRNSGTISATGFSDSGITLQSGGQITNIGISSVIAGAFNGITIAGAVGTVANEGFIVGTTAYGISLHTGGQVTNSVTGFISGYRAGIDMVGAGTVNNAGTINGQFFAGIALDSGGNIANSGTIQSNNVGVISFGDNATISNTGTIRGTGTYSSAITLLGGSVSNMGSAALISGQQGIIFLNPTGIATVINSGTISSSGVGIQVPTTNGYIANIGATATILGETGVVFSGGSQTLVNSGTITGTNGIGVQLALATIGNVENIGTNALISGNGIDGIGISANNGGMLTNSGSVTGTDKGVEFYRSGSINNIGTAARISGGNTGVYIVSPVEITNSGTIFSIGPSSIGIDLHPGVNITGIGQLSYSEGQYRASTSSVINNQAGGVISGVGIGIRVADRGALIANNGEIAGTGTTGVGVQFISGASQLTNGNGGLITGYNTGASVSGGRTWIINYSTISGTSSTAHAAGIAVSDGSAVITNHGVISATGTSSVGILFAGNGQGTIDNFGTIIGGSGTAIRFAGGTNELIIETGGVLSGLVDGSNGQNTLLFEGTGTLTNAQIVGFDSTAFSAPTTIGSGSTVANAAFINGGSSTNNGTITNTVTVANGAMVANVGVFSLTGYSNNAGSLTNSGTISTTGNGTFSNTGSFANSGTVSGDTTGVVNSGSVGNTGSITGGTTGVVVASGTLTNGTLTNGGTLDNSGTITGGSTGVMVNGGTLVNGTLTNAGTLTNQAGGYIQGGTYGIVVGAGGSGTNAGTIVDNLTAGASLGANATFDNTATGTIRGVTGVIFTGTGASLTNEGIITGTGGVAVDFQGGANTLTLDTGTVLTGSIEGEGSAGTIDLIGTGTLTNAINNFGAGSTLTIANTADWTASGTWTVANVTNAGTFQPGSPGNPLRLTGNFTQSSTGTLRVLLDDVSNSGSELIVTGSAALAGAVAVVPSGQFLAAKTYTIVNATGPVTGTFGGGATVNSALLVPTLSYDAHDAFVTLAQVPVASPPASPPVVSPPASPPASPPVVSPPASPPVVSPPASPPASPPVVSPPASPPVVSPPASPPASPPVVSPPASPPVVSPPASPPVVSPPAIVETSNQHAVAVAFDAGLAANPTGFATAIRGLDQLNAAGVTSSLDRLSGESHASLATTALQTGALFADQFIQQGVLTRLGASGSASGQSAMAAGGRQELARLDGGTDDPVANIDKPWGVWTSGYGQEGQLSGNGNSHRLDETIAGGSVGADYKLTPALRIGAGLGYGGTTFSLDDGGGRGQVDHTQVALYSSYTVGPVYIDGTVGFAYGDGTTRRNVSLPGLVGQAAGHTTDTQILGEIETGYGLNLGAATLTPFAGLSFGTVDQDGFTETGAGALDLHVAKQSQSSVKSKLGTRLTADLPLGATILSTDVSIGWAHEFAPTSRGTIAAFTGAPGAGFQVAGAKLPGDSALVGFGVATALFANTSIYVHYDGDLASGASSNAITAGFRWSW